MNKILVQWETVNAAGSDWCVDFSRSSFSHVVNSAVGSQYGTTLPLGLSCVKSLIGAGAHLAGSVALALGLKCTSERAIILEKSFWRPWKNPLSTLIKNPSDDHVFRRFSQRVATNAYWPHPNQTPIEWSTDDESTRRDLVNLNFICFFKFQILIGQIKPRCVKPGYGPAGQVFPPYLIWLTKCFRPLHWGHTDSNI